MRRQTLALKGLALKGLARKGLARNGLALVAVVVAAGLTWRAARLSADAPTGAAEPAEEHHWKVHDMTRPRPPVITPGTASTADQPGKPPSDAIVLFDGTDLSQWTAGGKEAPWKIENGAMVATKASIDTRQAFGDVQLHVEWAEPTPAVGSSQGRGNSGVLFMQGRYEIQVLDSYQNDTYPDGQCGAVYGQHPPLVNASRPPGEWQTYDIVFHAPHFEGNRVKEPATVTVFQNGVLVQDHWSIKGTTFHGREPAYSPHPAKLPIQLQFHNNPIRYRNVWARPLGEDAAKPTPPTEEQMKAGEGHH